MRELGTMTDAEIATKLELTEDEVIALTLSNPT
jgi:hypothetical protein